MIPRPRLAFHHLQQGFFVRTRGEPGNEATAMSTVKLKTYYIAAMCMTVQQAQTCNNKEMLSPSTGHCCSLTAMQDLLNYVCL